MPDLKPENILLRIEDNKIIHALTEEEEEEEERRTPAKIGRNWRSYPHRDFGDLRGPPGRPKIAASGLAVEASGDAYNYRIQPDLLRVPEVIR